MSDNNPNLTKSLTLNSPMPFPYAAGIHDGAKRFAYRPAYETWSRNDQMNYESGRTLALSLMTNGACTGKDLIRSISLAKPTVTIAFWQIVYKGRVQTSDYLPSKSTRLPPAPNLRFAKPLSRRGQVLPIPCVAMTRGEDLKPINMESLGF